MELVSNLDSLCWSLNFLQHYCQRKKQPLSQ